MENIKNISVERLMSTGFAATLAVLLLVCANALSPGGTGSSATVQIALSIVLLCFVAVLMLLARRQARVAVAAPPALRIAPLLKSGALQDAIFNSANFSSIATDAK